MNHKIIKIFYLKYILIIIKLIKIFIYNKLYEN